MRVRAPIMDKNSPNILVSVVRANRLVLHLCYGMLLAAIYPHLYQIWQRRILKMWSRQLLDILNIGIQIDGQQPGHGEGGCLMVANHVSWLDMFVLNATQPTRFIAKSEVRGWPVVGWLSRRSGTIFIERAMRQDATSVNLRISALLKQGDCVGLFPEGTTTDGKQVGHFHSALIQPAIDAGVMLCPIALRYQNEEGELSSTAAFTGDTTLVQSIWQILRCRHLDALVVFTPSLLAEKTNRRILARTAQDAIAQVLQTINPARHTDKRPARNAFPRTLLASQSAYALLIDPLLQQLRK